MYRLNWTQRYEELASDGKCGCIESWTRACRVCTGVEHRPHLHCLDHVPSRPVYDVLRKICTGLPEAEAPST